MKRAVTFLSAALACGALAISGSCGGDAEPQGPTAGTSGGGTAGAGRSGEGGNAGTGGGSGGANPGGQGGAAPGGQGGAAGGAGASAPSDGGAAGAGGAAVDAPAAMDMPPAAPATVVIFVIDGLARDAAETAAANGATNLKFVIDNGVVVQNAYSTSPAARTTLANGDLPWGNATSGNIALHTGTHLFEAGPAGLDDIFLATRRADIKSVFSGGDANYSGLNTADFKYAARLEDAEVVTRAIEHLKNDKVRLLRLHLQRIRDSAWSGPAGKTNPNSDYVQHIVGNDALLGQLIQALKDEGVWDNTYLIITADHGMGQGSGSDHPPSTRSSWEIFMAFYGPGLKKGATIPYAESPDVAVTAMRFFGLPSLMGHTAANVNLAQEGPTGTVLTNLFEGAPQEVAHPRYVEQYLELGTFQNGGTSYTPYRMGMLNLIK